MALADTARLIASLELQDKFSGPARNIDRSLGGLEGRTSRLGRIGSEVGRGVGSVVQNMGRLALVGGGLIATQVAFGVQTLVKLEELGNQTNAVVESTGSVANVTAVHVRELAESLENLTTIDDKAIQAGENMLLTFTNIRNEVGEGNDIFDQATLATLNMSTALGQDATQSALQLGKALNDPIRGITALRRVGVNFTDEQREQIKVLVESGRVMDAQKIILAELTTEFGGSAAALGEGVGASQRRFSDAIEDAQAALATGFLPVIEKVSAKIQELLGDPANLDRLRGFGEGLAGAFDDIVDFAGQVPWGAIGSALDLAGRGAKAALDFFKSMPPWVQTAVITGWGLNKLTGGALGNIVGALGSGLIKGVLGMNAGVVNINAGVVNGGGGVPGARGGGGGLIGNVARGAAVGVAAASPVLAGLAVVEVINFENMRQEQREGLQGILDELPRTAGSIDTSIARIDSQIAQDRPLLEGILFNTNVKPQLDAERAELVLLRGSLLKQTAAIDASIGSAAQADHQDAADAVARLVAIDSSIGSAAAADRSDAATAAGRLSAIDSSIGSAAQSDRADSAAQRAAIAAAKERIAAVVAAVGAAQTAKAETVAAAVRTNTAVLGAKNFAPDIDVTTNVTSNVSISDVQRRITSQQIAQSVSVGGGGFAV